MYIGIVGVPDFTQRNDGGFSENVWISRSGGAIVVDRPLIG